MTKKQRKEIGFAHMLIDLSSRLGVGNRSFENRRIKEIKSGHKRKPKGQR